MLSRTSCFSNLFNKLLCLIFSQVLQMFFCYLLNAVLVCFREPFACEVLEDGDSGRECCQSIVAIRCQRDQTIQHSLLPSLHKATLSLSRTCTHIHHKYEVTRRHQLLGHSLDHFANIDRNISF